ncbi:MAG: hypothetical protein IJK02_10965 [Clostridia bacterium]|nr:hypothetical protein [Clostridia bacterium]
MKNKKKLFLFLIPALVIALLTCFAVCRRLSAGGVQIPEKNRELSYVCFGKYPQSQVKDEKLIKELERLPLRWQSYGYYNGDGSLGSAVQSDYMQYADVGFDGETYRAVRFSDYRSFCCHTDPKGTSWQPALFDLDTVYWYRFDPIRWVILSKSENLLMSELILDSQPFNSIIYAKKPELGFDAPAFYKDEAFTIYATDYYTSDLRGWLNADFYETAFSDDEKALITESEQDNAAWSRRYSEYDSPASLDRVFLLSYAEATNPAYGFSKTADRTDDLRTAYATDYAVCQGICTMQDFDRDGTAWWWLRTGGVSSMLNLGVNFYGSIRFTLTTPYTPDCVDTGVRPALRLSRLP